MDIKLIIGDYELVATHDETTGGLTVSAIKDGETLEQFTVVPDDDNDFPKRRRGINRANPNYQEREEVGDGEEVDLTGVLNFNEFASTLYSNKIK